MSGYGGGYDGPLVSIYEGFENPWIYGFGPVGIKMLPETPEHLRSDYGSLRCFMVFSPGL